MQLKKVLGWAVVVFLAWYLLPSPRPLVMPSTTF